MYQRLKFIFHLAVLIITFSLIVPSTYANSRGVKVIINTRYGEKKEVPLYSGYYALVIGCAEYNKGWPRLPNPINDAREVANYFKELGWTVDLLENPTSTRFRSRLNRLIVGPGKENDKGILIWYSGHGHTLNEADGTKLGYLVPVDTPDPELDEIGFMNKAISMRQIETVAKRIFSKHVIMIFDSCFSGAIFQLVRAKPSLYIQEKVAAPVRQFITAGNEKEQVPDKSIFKDVFIQGIRHGYADRNQDGYITGEELGSYISEQVINYSRKTQHPQYGKINNPKLDKGDFVIVKGETDELPIASMEIERLKREKLILRKQIEELKRQSSDKALAGKKYKELDQGKMRRLAVFPFYIGSSRKFSVSDEKDTMNNIINISKNDSHIRLTHTYLYYAKYGAPHSLQNVRDTIIDMGETNFWTSGSSKKPNVQTSIALAKELNVDLVLTYKIISGTTLGTGGKTFSVYGYLIDVDNSRVYESKADRTYSDMTFSDFALIGTLTKKLFVEYTNKKR